LGDIETIQNLVSQGENHVAVKPLIWLFGEPVALAVALIAGMILTGWSVGSAVASWKSKPAIPRRQEPETSEATILKFHSGTDSKRLYVETEQEEIVPIVLKARKGTKYDRQMFSETYGEKWLRVRGQVVGHQDVESQWYLSILQDSRRRLKVSDRDLTAPAAPLHILGESMSEPIFTLWFAKTSHPQYGVVGLGDVVEAEGIVQAGPASEEVNDIDLSKCRILTVTKCKESTK
jgi:hypothetical protein